MGNKQRQIILLLLLLLYQIKHTQINKFIMYLKASSKITISQIKVEKIDKMHVLQLWAVGRAQLDFAAAHICT